MGLIVTDYLHKDADSKSGDFSDYFFHIDEKYLLPYSLTMENKLLGKISDARWVVDKEESDEDLVGSEIELRPGEDQRRVYISRSSFRDLSKLGDGIWMEVFISKGFIDGDWIKLFGERRIRIDNLENPEIHCPNKRYFMRNINRSEY